MFRRTKAALASAILALAAYGDTMNETQNTANDAGANHAAIPLEPGSDAVILSATHLFVVETLQMQGGAWARGANGLQHRTLHLGLRLVENLKGALRAKNGAEFALDVPQERESAMAVSDYHGFWSHARIEQGKSYLAASSGRGEDPAELMKEPAIRALFDAALEADVKLTIDAERRFGAALRKENGQRVAAARDLLQFAGERRQSVRQLFSQYLWERVAPAFSEDEEALEPAVLRLVEAPDSSVPLREALVNGAYGELISPEPSPAQTRLLRALLELLLQPAAAPMFDRLIQVPIYNLAFPGGRAAHAAAELIADRDERARMAAIAAGFPSAKAKTVADWLNGR
jgi:hypothetical protein